MTLIKGKNMNYQKIYDQLVQKKHLFSNSDYFEIHHKIPKSIGGKNDLSNLVKLTAREHYIAHLLLVKIAKQLNDDKMYVKMLHAFNCMRWGRNNGARSFKFNSRLYQSVKEKFSKIRSNEMKTNKNPSNGKIWIHSDKLKKSKQWNKESFIPEGWEIGRVVDWNLHFRKYKKKQTIKEENEKKNLIYSEMYKIYSTFGWKFMVEKYNYKYSLTNFTKICKKRVKEFVSQKGKKRGK